MKNINKISDNLLTRIEDRLESIGESDLDIRDIASLIVYLPEPLYRDERIDSLIDIIARSIVEIKQIL